MSVDRPRRSHGAVIVSTVAVAATVAAMWAIAALASPGFLDSLSKLGPVATGLVAIFALVVGISTIRQKQVADAATANAERRDQWWKRAQWAIDRLYEPPEERRVVAWRILQVLAESNLASDEELAIFRAASADWFARPQGPDPVPGDLADKEDNDGDDQGGLTP